MEILNILEQGMVLPTIIQVNVHFLDGEIQ